jgi:hypothetical protein
MEIFCRKRKEPAECAYSKYEVYRKFCFVEVVSQEIISHAADIIVRGARFLSIQIDWEFFWDQIRENRNLPPLLKVPDHDFLIGIAEMLRLLMLHDPSLFDFCIFSDMPDLVMTRIVECLAEIGGTTECRTLCKKWYSFATDEKIFPKLRHMDLTLVSCEQWQFLFLLHLLVDVIPDGTWLFFNGMQLMHVKPEFCFKKKEGSLCFPGYPEEVDALRFLGVRKVYQKMGPIVAHMDCYFESTIPLSSEKGLVKAYGSTSRQDCTDRSVFAKKMEQLEFRKWMRCFYLREIKENKT